MQMTIKTSMVLIVVIGALLFFALNHWMSGEIGKPVVTEPAVVKNNPGETAVVESRPLNVPMPSVQTDVQEPAEAPTETQKQQKTEHVDPVYDPPSQDVILVQ